MWLSIHRVAFRLTTSVVSLRFSLVIVSLDCMGVFDRKNEFDGRGGYEDRYIIRNEIDFGVGTMYAKFQCGYDLRVKFLSIKM